MSERFSLKWNDFQSNVCNSFSLLRNEEYLHDVTIVTDDNEHTVGHKLVLSASSEYFKSIFKKNKNSHPLLCLEGVSSKDVRNILDYIYNGEVQILQEDLDRFLNVAQRLRLEGLQQSDSDAGQEDEVPFKNGDILKQEFIREKTKPKPPHPVNGYGKEIAKVRTDIYPADNITEVDEQIEQNIVRNSDGSLSCNICGKNSGKRLSNMKTHIETHFEGLSFNCPMCEKTCRSRHALASHKTAYHRNPKNNI